MPVHQLCTMVGHACQQRHTRTRSRTHTHIQVTKLRSDNSRLKENVATLKSREYQDKNSAAANMAAGMNSAGLSSQLKNYISQVIQPDMSMHFCTHTHVRANRRTKSLRTPAGRLKKRSCARNGCLHRRQRRSSTSVCVFLPKLQSYMLVHSCIHAPIDCQVEYRVI